MALRTADAQIIKTRLYSTLVGNAKKRRLPITLSKEHAFKLFESPCAYCGGFYAYVYARVGHRTTQHTCNSIDRVDSSLGYIENNVVSCCWICNRAKSKMPEHEFRAWIDRLTAFTLARQLVKIRQTNMSMDVGTHELRATEGPADEGLAYVRSDGYSGAAG